MQPALKDWLDFCDIRSLNSACGDGFECLIQSRCVSSHLLPVARHDVNMLFPVPSGNDVFC